MVRILDNYNNYIMATGFIYKWTNTINGKWYIGSHKGDPSDGYRHSSKVLAAAEKKHEFENFIREILFEGDYEKDTIREKEADLLVLYDAANHSDSYNQSNIKGVSCLSQEARDKIALASHLRERLPEERQRLSQALSGRKHSSEHIANKSASLKGRQAWNKGIPRTAEWKKQHSETMKGKKHRTIPCTNCHRKIGINNINRHTLSCLKILLTYNE